MKEPKEKAYLEFMHWGETIRITFDHHDITIDEAEQTFHRLLLAAGFQPSHIKKTKR